MSKKNVIIAVEALVESGFTTINIDQIVDYELEKFPEGISGDVIKAAKAAVYRYAKRHIKEVHKTYAGSIPLTINYWLKLKLEDGTTFTPCLGIDRVDDDILQQALRSCTPGLAGPSPTFGFMLNSDPDFGMLVGPSLEMSFGLAHGAIKAIKSKAHIDALFADVDRVSDDLKQAQSEFKTLAVDTTPHVP